MGCEIATVSAAPHSELQKRKKSSFKNKKEKSIKTTFLPF